MISGFPLRTFIGYHLGERPGHLEAVLDAEYRAPFPVRLQSETGPAISIGR